MMNRLRKAEDFVKWESREYLTTPKNYTLIYQTPCCRPPLKLRCLSWSTAIIESGRPLGFWTDFLAFALIGAVFGGRYYCGLDLSPFHTSSSTIVSICSASHLFSEVETKPLA